MKGYLRRFPRFAALDVEDLGILERVLVVHRFHPDHVFVREGEHATGVTAEMHLLVEGRVEVS